MLIITHISRIAIVCALGCALLVPAAATAMPSQDMRGEDVRTSSLAGTTEPRQDLRSPDARDAAVQQDLRHLPAAINAPGATAADSATRPAPRTLPGPPAWPSNPQPITVVPAAEPTGDGGGIDWAPIGIGIAGGLLAVGGIAALVGHRRTQRLRVAA